jgi:hypothetical protein
MSVFAAGLVTLTGLLAAKSYAGSVPQRPPENGTPTAKQGVIGRKVTTLPVFALDAGLAGPPIIARDGSWWVLGRDGQLVHIAADDTVDWAIGVGAAITGEATTGDNELVFAPMANDLIIAVQPGGTPRWRSRTARGVEGPLAWVPGQGLVFVGRDQNVCWLGANAALLQTQRLVGRQSAGPVAIGGAFAIGTETGDVLVWSSRNTPARLKLSHPIHSIIAHPPSELLVLAGSDAYNVATRGQVLWQRAGVVALGSAIGGAIVLITQSGHAEWLNGRGEVESFMEGCRDLDGEGVPEVAATSKCAWISGSSGNLTQCCFQSGVKRFQLARVPLQRPVIDPLHHRVLVASSAREVWAVSLTRGTGQE